MLNVGVCCNVVSVHCSLVVTCWERAYLLSVVCVVFCHFPKCVLVHIRIKGEVCAVKPVLCFSFVCLLCLCVRLFICALWSPAGKGLSSWLSFVVSNCEFVTFPLVS